MPTDYLHPAGMGERRDRMIVTCDLTFGGIQKDPHLLVSGINEPPGFFSGLYFTNGQSVTGKYVRFRFASAVIVDEINWTQSAANTHGTWKVQASNNGVDWSDLSSTFTLGGTNQYISFSNSTGYLYYQLLGVSGTTSSAATLYEANFKAENAPGSTYYTTDGCGNRTASITGTQSSPEPFLEPTYGTPADIIDGSMANEAAIRKFFVPCAGLWLKYQFSQPRIVTEVFWVQNSAGSGGTWKWQGSNNDSDWTDIGGTFTLGGAARTFHTSLNGNTESYTYYRLIGVSGGVGDWRSIQEILFSIIPGVTATWTAEAPATFEIVSGVFAELIIEAPAECSFAGAVPVTASLTITAAAQFGAIAHAGVQAYWNCNAPATFRVVPTLDGTEPPPSDGLVDGNYVF